MSRTTISTNVRQIMNAHNRCLLRTASMASQKDHLSTVSKTAMRPIPLSFNVINRGLAGIAVATFQIPTSTQQVPSQLDDAAFVTHVTRIPLTVPPSKLSQCQQKFLERTRAGNEKAYANRKASILHYFKKGQVFVDSDQMQADIELYVAHEKNPNRKNCFTKRVNKILDDWTQNGGDMYAEAAFPDKIKGWIREHKS